MKKWRIAGLLMMVVGLAAGCGASGESTSGQSDSSTAQETSSEAPNESVADAGQDSETESVAEAEYIFKFAHVGPASGVEQDGSVYLMDKIEEHSGGRISGEVYPAGQLAEKQAALEGLQLGTIEITEVAATDLAQFDNLWDVLALPYLFESGEQAIAVIQDPKVQEIVNQSINDMGFVVLHWRNYGERNILNNKHAINAPADMEGIKIRVMQSPALVNAIEALGASPITLAWTECYTGMQQGTIDAIENSVPVIVSGGYQEVGKYYSLTKHFIVPDPVMISKSVYDSLPEDLQQAVMEAGADTGEYWNGDIWPAAEEADLLTLQESGVEINEPDLAPFMEIAEQVNEATVAEFDERQLEFYNTILEVKEQYQ